MRFNNITIDKKRSLISNVLEIIFDVFPNVIAHLHLCDIRNSTASC